MSTPSTPTGGGSSSGASSKPNPYLMMGKLLAYEAGATLMFKLVERAQYADFAKPFLFCLFLFPFISIALEYWDSTYTRKAISILFWMWIGSAAFASVPLFVEGIIALAYKLDPGLGDTATRVKSGAALQMRAKLEHEMLGARTQLLEGNIRVEELIVGKQIIADIDALNTRLASRSISDDDYFAESKKQMTRLIAWKKHGEEVNNIAAGNDPNDANQPSWKKVPWIGLMGLVALLTVVAIKYAQPHWLKFTFLAVGGAALLWLYTAAFTNVSFANFDFEDISYNQILVVGVLAIVAVEVVKQLRGKGEESH